MMAKLIFEVIAVNVYYHIQLVISLVLQSRKFWELKNVNLLNN